MRSWYKLTKVFLLAQDEDKQSDVVDLLGRAFDSRGEYEEVFTGRKGFDVNDTVSLLL